MIEPTLADFIDSDTVLYVEGSRVGERVAFVGSFAKPPEGVPCYRGEEIFELHRLNGEDDALLRPANVLTRQAVAQELVFDPEAAQAQPPETVLQWLHRARLALGGKLSPTPGTVEAILGRPYLSRERIEELWKGWDKGQRKRYLARRDWALALIAECSRRARAEDVYMTEEQAKFRAANYAARRTMREARPGILED